VHLLGYLPDPQHAGLKEQTAKIRSHRDHRLQLMVEKLSVDFDITWEEVAAHIPEGATAGRPHIAHILIEKGFFLDTTEAFAGPLRADGPYHVPHYAPRLAEGIRVLRDAGAVPILAPPLHPGAPLRGAVDHQRGPAEILEGYRILADAGLAGLEIHHRENTEQGKEVLSWVAKELDFIVTGSSDFHGTKNLTLWRKTPPAKNSTPGFSLPLPAASPFVSFRCGDADADGSYPTRLQRPRWFVWGLTGQMASIPDRGEADLHASQPAG